MTHEEQVKQAYPDAEVYIDLFGGGALVIGAKSVGVTLGAAHWSREEAWADAANRLATPDPKETQE